MSDARVYGINSSGDTLDLCVGERVVLALDEIPSSGYSWELEESEHFKLVGDSHQTRAPELVALGVPGRIVAEVEREASSDLVGGSVTRVLVVEAVSQPEGVGVLRARKGRPWQPESYEETPEFTLLWCAR